MQNFAWTLNNKKIKTKCLTSKNISIPFVYPYLEFLGARVATTAFRFAIRIRIYLLRFTWSHHSLIESIRSPKIGTSDSIVLVVGVCLPNHRSTDYRSWHDSQDHDARAHVISAGNGQWGTHILEGSTPHTAPSQAAHSLPPPALIRRIDFLAWIELKLFLANRNALVATV